MENEDILLDPKLDDDVLMIHAHFNTPYNTETKFPLQYHYINQFIDLLLARIDIKSDKFGIVSDVDGMKHFLSFLISEYDEYQMNVTATFDDKMPNSKLTEN